MEKKKLRDPIYLHPFLIVNPKGIVKIHQRNPIIGWIQPPVFPVKFENTTEIREYMKYINPKIINTVPNVWFLLNTLPCIYLIPIYIPNTEIIRTKKANKKKGRRLSISTPEAKPKEGTMNKEMISPSRNIIERVKVTIPTVLDFNFVFRISILKWYFYYY